MEELYKLISDDVAAAISARLSIEKLSEIRIRNGMPVRVCYDGVYYFLGAGGICRDCSGAFIAGGREAESVVLRACERSLYTVSENIKNGYVAVRGGIRIGVCGSAVFDGDRLTAVKDFTAVNIRLPHEIKGCAAGILAKIESGGRVGNTLIISPPAAGKTTVVRDLARLISDRGYNVLLCDERYEIASVRGGVPTLDVGRCTDVISGQDKRYAFRVGVAYMRPDVIVTDELFERDMESVDGAVHCGTAVISTVHARNLGDFFEKPEYAALVGRKIFSRFVVLDGAPTWGASVFDETARRLA